MTRAEIDTTLRQIFSDLFDEPAESISYETSPDTLLDWDSMAHVRLIAALEEKFEVAIPPEDQVDMLTFELVGDVLVDRIQA